ncbi:MAG: hypothetical protein ACRDRO_04365 [Pseudonocardiaceae bacterium]
MTVTTPTTALHPRRSASRAILPTKRHRGTVATPRRCSALVHDQQGPPTTHVQRMLQD